MPFTVATAPLADFKGAALAIMLAEGQRTLAGPAAEVDRLTGGRVGAVLAAGDFRGKAGEAQVIYTAGNVDRVVLVGLGATAKHSLESVRNAAGKAAMVVRDLGVKQLALLLPELPLGSPAELARAVAEGAQLSQFQYLAYRTKDLDDVKRLDEVQLLAPGADQAALEAAAEEATLLAETVAQAREWILMPGDDLPPAKLAEVAVAAGRQLGLETTVFDKAELARRGFNTLLAVGQGSVNDPCLIQLAYNGGAAGEAPIVIVGKGITFDTGGLGIKPGPGMEKMKYDMAGGASAIAIVLACAKLGLKRNVTTIVAAAENMPSASAVKPGDIVTSFKGLTIEINDTDAEGRLVLADALAYATTLKPAMIVDMATLTGSVAVALGRKIMGVMGNDQALVERFLKVAEQVGERGWQLPVFDEHFETLESMLADMKNYGGRYGDTVNAASMLQKFVDDVPWLHLDIAGAGWSEEERGYRPKGPTGTPIRAVVELIKQSS